MTDNAIPKSRWHLLDTKEKIEEQIKVRRDTLKMLIGNLYPPIVEAEIKELIELHTKMLEKNGSK